MEQLYSCGKGAIVMNKLMLFINFFIYSSVIASTLVLDSIQGHVVYGYNGYLNPRFYVVGSGNLGSISFAQNNKEYEIVSTGVIANGFVVLARKDSGELNSRFIVSYFDKAVDLISSHSISTSEISKYSQDGSYGVYNRYDKLTHRRYLSLINIISDQSFDIIENKNEMSTVFTRDSKYLFYCDTTGLLWKYDIKAKTSVKVMDIPIDLSIEDISCDNNKMLATDGQSIFIINLELKELSRICTFHNWPLSFNTVGGKQLIVRQVLWDKNTNGFFYTRFGPWHVIYGMNISYYAWPDLHYYSIKTKEDTKLFNSFSPLIELKYPE